MSGVAQDEARVRRARHPLALAIGIGFYVLAVIAGMFVLVGTVGPGVQVPLWIAHGLLLAVLVRKLAAKESIAYAMTCILVTSLISVYTADMARDDLTLQQRGENIAVRVVEKWQDPAGQGKAREYNYALERLDGSKVPGPALKASSDLYDVGQTLTVLADPKGELRPKTSARSDATREVIVSAALTLGAVGAVAWMAWRWSDSARRRGKRQPVVDVRKVYKAVTRNTSTQEEQEEQLREALRTYPADRRGYIKVPPEEYPDVSQRRASRIAWEMGLRAEAAGNRGSWRFRETVVEEVPRD